MSRLLQLITWNLVAAFVGGVLPAIAAVRAGVSLTRDPAGQSALAWLVLAGCTALGPVVRAFGGVKMIFALTAATVVLMPLVLAPPVLTWAGPRVKRWQPLILAALATTLGGMLVVLRPGRTFQVVAHPTMCIAMTILLLLALRSQMERHGAEHGVTEPLRTGWLWLIGGHLAYFLSSIFWFPMLETLALRGMQLAADAHLGLLVMHFGAMAAIARGVVLSSAAARETAALPVSSSAIA